MRQLDWHRLAGRRGAPALAADSRRRFRLLALLFALAAACVFGRVVALEVLQGDRFRTAAAQPLTREVSAPGRRGRILARDGSVLAQDKWSASLAVHYRYLQSPPEPRWLRNAARARLPRGRRSDAAALAAAEAALRKEIEGLHARLAVLSGIGREAWQARRRRVQRRVERIAQRVNQRRRRAAAAPPAYPDDDSWWGCVRHAVLDALRSADDDRFEPVTVAEELDYHVIAVDVPDEAAETVAADPDAFPGVQVVRATRRDYPQGPLAGSLLGYVGAQEQPDERYHPEDNVGKLGLEAACESTLHGRRGVVLQEVDRSGRVLSARALRAAEVGRDVVLTLDLALQRTAEQLLDEALARSAELSLDADAAASGGAVVVLDVGDGAILAAASAPRFDPNAFTRGDAAAVRRLLAATGGPLFERTSRMALPPGSVFKAFTAVALLESEAVVPEEPLFCRGYLHEPERMRCALFVRRGVGHGELDLASALAQSCNVFFFLGAERMGSAPLLQWAERFGFGQPTGVDLPAEAPGTLPGPDWAAEHDRPWQTADTQTLAIGQNALQATPLQVARAMAAVANGGRLVTPHLLAADARPPQPVAGLSRGTLAAVRQGLEQVVAAPQGTAHDTVWLESLPIAGKTGTAEAGRGLAPHAWFAGYAPADDPQVAVVVALQHGGGGGEEAGPLVKRLALRMQQLGYIGAAAE